MDPSKVCLLCTGSQGEPLAAISRIANGTHKQIKLQENDLVISSIESLKNNYQSLIKSKLDEGFKSINDLQDQYNWTKALNEPWLDDTTRMYEIQKFQLSVQSEIDNTASESAQKRLNEVMEEQLDILRTKDQLTKNDVDRANKIFDITKKRKIISNIF